jgi:sec-independent protein translocase protein TatB
MEFLGIGPLELVFILLIALIVIGPRDIAKTARTLGRFLNKLYKSEGWRTFLDASRNLRGLPNRLAREAEIEELKELKELRKDMTEAGQGLTKDLKAMEAELRPRATPPVSPPASAPAAPEPSPDGTPEARED